MPGVRWQGSWGMPLSTAGGGSDTPICASQGRPGLLCARKLEGPGGEVWTFRRGRIVRWEAFARQGQALEAAGLLG